MSVTLASGEIRIRTLSRSDSIDELTRLLNRAYRQYAEDGLLFLASHQDADVTRHRIGAGACFVAELGSKIAGTITYHFPCQSVALHTAKCVQVARIAQLAVDPDQWGGGIGSRLMSHAECRARRDGADELALDTAESASRLIAWYCSLGYQIVSSFGATCTNYRSVIMSKDLRGELSR
ncbi:MAG: GNAT family N-acetyltransferase [Candidatus Zixiibacteriota bacterium]|nr:MAG: GNAT family N-acetyltransferase [candidate division Zixibacteria bacterium]